MTREPWLGRVFGVGESPLAWSVPLGRITGVRVRAHLVLVVWLLAQAALALREDRPGLAFALPPAVLVLALVLLHEMARAIVCRRLGGHAHGITLWPLGGLEGMTPPRRWRAHAAVAFAGPGIHLLLAPVWAGLFVALGGPASALVFNPLNPGGAFATLAIDAEQISAAVTWAWWAHAVNTILLLANLFVPMHPLDGAEWFRAVLTPRLGHDAATRATQTASFVAAAGLAVFGAVFEAPAVLLLGVCGGMVTWMDRARVSALDALGDPSYVGPSPRESRPEKDAVDTRPPSRARVDRILAKISREGMESLTADERATLDRARGQSPPTPPATR